jgi:DNA-binding transcriptional LysR family regulator
MRNVSVRQLHYFVHVAECGKISQAADTVGRTQSAVTAAIRDLEVELDVTLFERHAGGVILTSSGRELLPRAYRILREVEDAARSVKTIKQDIEGRVNVGAKDIVAAYYVPGPLTRFRLAHSRIEVTVTEMTRAHVDTSLNDGSIDFGILALRRGGPSEPEGRSILTLEHHFLHLWVSEDHPFLSRETVSPADIASEPYIIWTRDEFETVTLTNFAAFGLSPRVAIRVSSIEAVRSLVANGAGVTIMPDLVYRPRSLEGLRVERIKSLELFQGASAISLVWQTSHQHSPAARAFKDFLQKEASGFTAPRPVEKGRRANAMAS